MPRKSPRTATKIPSDMKLFLNEVKAFSKMHGRIPQTILNYSIGANYAVWDKWISGVGSPTYMTAEKVRVWMANAPPPVSKPVTLRQASAKTPSKRKSSASSTSTVAAQ